MSPFGANSVPAPMRARKRRVPPCPCCGASGGLCDTHKARLAGIREGMAEYLKVNGTYASRSDQRKYRWGDGKGRGATCCQPNCWNVREVGDRYCDACQADGWREEDE